MMNESIDRHQKQSNLGRRGNIWCIRTVLDTISHGTYNAIHSTSPAVHSTSATANNSVSAVHQTVATAHNMPSASINETLSAAAAAAAAAVAAAAVAAAAARLSTAGKGDSLEWLGALEQGRKALWYMRVHTEIQR